MAKVEDGYKYHKETKEYINKVGFVLEENGYKRLPPNATDIKPLGGLKGQAVVFNEDTKSWSYKLDRRGTKYYLEDGSEKVIANIGEDVPKNGLLTPPDLRSLEDMRTDAIEEIEKQYAERLDLLTGNEAIQEVLTWSMKFDVANKILNGVATEEEISLLKTEADGRGQKVEDLAKLIKHKGKKYIQFVGNLGNIRGEYKRIVKASKNKSDIRDALIMYTKKIGQVK